MESVPPHIRLATVDDLPAIHDIYNHYVLHSTCTYQDEVEPLSARQAWFAARGPEHPVTVAELGGEVVGWGALSRFHARSAYRRTVENAVYVRHGVHRRGVGRALMVDLIERARSLGHHTVIALVDAEQRGSLALHERLGFARAGHLREAGFKFDRWLDVVYLQRML
jgi:L-amino acid N-acyltransferase YncA